MSFRARVKIGVGWSLRLRRMMVLSWVLLWMEEAFGVGVDGEAALWYHDEVG